MFPCEDYDPQGIMSTQFYILGIINVRCWRSRANDDGGDGWMRVAAQSRIIELNHGQTPTHLSSASLVP